MAYEKQSIEKFEYEVFLSVIPGLEDYCREEVNTKAQQLDLRGIIETSDMTLKSNDLFTLLNFIKNLRIPTRALLRIDSFTARDLPKLYKRLLKIKWNDYLPTSDYQVKVSSQNSRLFDDRKIEKALRDAISDYQKAQPLKAKYVNLEWDSKPTIFLRFEQDHCQVSIDCSGTRLDMRGYKIATSKAPMRESMAAGLINFINKNESSYDLVDPMAGSGTIISEFLNQDKPNDKRSYNFENFPIYRKMPPKKLRTQTLQSDRCAQAFDIEEKNCKAIASNLKEENLEVGREDFFKRSNSYGDNFVIACNLPYGKRIKTKENIHLFIDKFLSHALSLGAKSIYIVVPETFKINSKKFKIKRSERVNNGGIWVQYIRVSRPSS